MKSKFFVLPALFLTCLLCSCEAEEKDTGTPPEKSETSVTELVGSTIEIPYETLLDKEMFKVSYESYTDVSNPLQLKDGACEDADVTEPFKSVLVDGENVVAPLNIWIFPVVDGNKYIGFINCDMRCLTSNEPVFFGGESFAPILNDALEKGSIALFNTVDGTYGIYEDNSVITLEADKSYNGTITFNQVNQEYNLITESSSNNIVYN